eukprot:COSAG02_NODE_1051_length_14956_cov_3.414216_9_plen_391_part_00
MQQVGRSRVTVATTGAPERSGTGPFDNLTLDTHINIFSNVELKDRLTIAIAVCKAWRSFRTQADLWRTVVIRDRWSAKLFVNGRGLTRLMAWLPPGVTEKLEISIQDKKNDRIVDAAAICAAMKSLRGWQGGINAKQKDLAPSALNELTISTRRAGGTMLKTIGALFGGGLKVLDVSAYACRKVTVDDVLKILPGMPNLTKLRIHKLDHSGIMRIAAALFRARSGVPLLTELSSEKDAFYLGNGCETFPDTVLGAGKLFPELEVLRLRGMAPLSVTRADFFDLQSTVTASYRMFNLTKETSCLPRVRELDIGLMSIGTLILQDEELRASAGDAVACFISTALAAGKVLQTARFQYKAPCEFLSKFCLRPVAILGAIPAYNVPDCASAFCC